MPEYHTDCVVDETHQDFDEYIDSYVDADEYSNRDIESIRLLESTNEEKPKSKEYILVNQDIVKDVLKQKEQEIKDTQLNHIATPLIVDESREVLNVTVCGDNELDIDFEESRSVLKI